MYLLEEQIISCEYKYVCGVGCFYLDDFPFYQHSFKQVITKSLLHSCTKTNLPGFPESQTAEPLFVSCEKKVEKMGGGTAEGNNRDDAIMKEISKRDRDVGKIERRKQ